MDEKTLHATLSDLPLGGLRYFDSTGSTNDLALAWAAESAPDLSLIVADEQTSGRGRSGRTWYTPAGSALAFSLILRPRPGETDSPLLFTAIGALALTATLHKKLNLRAKIKWPNDVLLSGRKTAGILVETAWLGDQIESLVLGMGVNIHAAAVPPAKSLDFPATSLESELGQPPDRLDLLHSILADILALRQKIDSLDLVRLWEDHLAYLGEVVQIWEARQASPPVSGHLVGLNPDGSLRLQIDSGETLPIHFGDVRLRPTGQ